MNIQKFFLAALTAALAAPVFALSTDRDQAIEVHADRFDGDEVKQTAVYTGNVIVDQGSMQITGARLEVRITPKGYRQATVTESPRAFVSNETQIRRIQSMSGCMLEPLRLFMTRRQIP